MLCAQVVLSACKKLENFPQLPRDYGQKTATRTPYWGVQLKVDGQNFSKIPNGSIFRPFLKLEGYKIRLVNPNNGIALIYQFWIHTELISSLGIVFR